MSGPEPADEIAQRLRERERRRQRLFEHALDAILLADDDGRYLDANPAACQLTGRTRQQLIGASVFDITPVPDHATGQRLWREFIAAGKQQGEYPLCRPDGSSVTIEYSAVANIEPGVHLSILRDVTARKEAERAMVEANSAAREATALRERQARVFDTILTSISDFAYIFDRDGRFIYSNKALLDLLGITHEQILGKNFFDLKYPDDLAARLQRQIQQVIDTRQPVTDETPYTSQSGAGGYYEYIFNPVFAADGSVESVAGTTRDVTHRREVEQALSEARDAAEHANNAKDRFLAVLSHELRTPLSPVVMSVTEMENDPDLPPKFREDVTTIRRNIELETKLIDDLLDLSRVTSDKLRLNLQPHGVHEILRHVIQICDADLREKRLNVIERLDATRDLASVDAARLQQVFWNLVRNATKFTPAGGDVTIRTWNDDAGHLCVDVIDSGIGIAPELLPRIFDAFEQGDARITRQFGGLGLGLAIAKAVVEMHGGAIRVASKGMGKGTTFTVRLDVVAASPVERDAACPSPAGAVGVAGPRLLLVDDHPDTARTLARLLTRSGYEVRTASSVAAALKLAAAEPFDLVVSDIGLPDGTGYELMQEARARYGLCGIALSGYGMEEDMRRSKDVGFVEHVVKPVNMAHLEQVIRRVIDASE